MTKLLRGLQYSDLVRRPAYLECRLTSIEERIAIRRHLAGFWKEQPTEQEHLRVLGQRGRDR